MPAKKVAKKVANKVARKVAKQATTKVAKKATTKVAKKAASKTENKTKPTAASVADYIASRATPQQDADCRALITLLARVTGKPPAMWGPSIVGFGSYHYTYESGRTGEAPLTGFAIRGRELVLYLLGDESSQTALRAKLGKHSMGKACLYFKQLADLDLRVLEQLVELSIADVRRRYGGA